MFIDTDLVRQAVPTHTPRGVTFDEPPVALPAELAGAYWSHDTDLIVFRFEFDRRWREFRGGAEPCGLTPLGYEQFTAVERLLASIGWALEPMDEFEDGAFYYTAHPLE